MEIKQLKSESESYTVKDEAKEEIEKGTNEMLFQCGRLGGDLGKKCYHTVRSFKDDINDVFKGEVRY